MKIIEVKSLDSLFRQLEALALSDNINEYVFRGHRNADWRLQSTFNRFSTSRLPEYYGLAVEEIVTSFADGLARIGDRRMVEMDRRGRLEFARHSGVPSPLIDFSRSPYVALWFAFNGVRGSVDKDQNTAIYALDWNTTGAAFDYYCELQGIKEPIRQAFGKLPIDLFRWDNLKFFEKGYPDLIKFIPFAASWNVRMNRQQGCFLYDGLDYSSLGVTDLEGLLTEHDTFKKFDALLTKFIIPTSFARQVFQHLEIVGMSGAHLYDGEAGVVQDVINTFNYQSRARSWDIRAK